MQPADLAYANPPVVEAVLGVQFAALPGWTNGHLGWFWKQYLSQDWQSAVDAPSLGDQFELFGEERKWQLRTAFQQPFQVRIGTTPLTRLQITSATGDRMLQLQPTRFLYNWQRRDSAYPSYKTMRVEFDALYSAFCRFVADSKLGEAPHLNQWEITYVDQIPRGPLWDTPADWHRVLPALFSAQGAVGGCPFESVIGGDWQYVIEPARGRVHVSVQSGRAVADDTNVLYVQTTARGPIRPEAGWGLDDGLELGHRAVIAAFTDIASPEAHQAWGIKER